MCCPSSMGNSVLEENNSSKGDWQGPTVVLAGEEQFDTLLAASIQPGSLDVDVAASFSH